VKLEPLNEAALIWLQKLGLPRSHALQERIINM
jgi:hypothetical protein